MCLHMHMVSKAYRYTHTCERTMHHIRGPNLLVNMANQDYHVLVFTQRLVRICERQLLNAWSATQDNTQNALLQAKTKTGHQYDMDKQHIDLHKRFKGLVQRERLPACALHPRTVCAATTTGVCAATKHDNTLVPTKRNNVPPPAPL